jgi:hypothetical protein
VFFVSLWLINDLTVDLETMNKRPLSVTVIGSIFIAAGIIGFAYHVPEFKSLRPFPNEIVWGLSVRLLAVLGGMFVLRRHNWARWLLLAWISFHVILSVFHSWSEVIVHGLLFIVVAYVLFRPRASAYFRSASCGDPMQPRDP